MRRDPEIAGGGDLEPAAEAPAGQPCNYRGREAAHRLAEVAQAGDEGFGGFLLELGHLLDVGAADHAFFALAGEDHGANAAVGCELLESLAHSVGDG